MMRRWGGPAFARVLNIAWVAVAIAGTAVAPKRVTGTIWRGSLRGDSLFVRATWIPTVREGWCLDFVGHNWGADSNAVRPKYLGYRIEDAHAHVRARGVLSEPLAEQFCCDGLDVASTPWRGGLVLELMATGWGCEPANDCMSFRFVYVAGHDTTASSEWTDIDWDPAVERLIDTWGNEGCLAYPMTVAPRVRGATLVFEPAFAPGVKAGDVFEEPTSQDEQWIDCVRPFTPTRSATVDLFATPGGADAQRLVVGASDRVEIVSTAIRAERTEGERLSPALYRIGIRVAGRRGFVTPADLRALGFKGL